MVLYEKIRLGGVTLPPELYVSIPTVLVHHDPDLWGKDVAEFNPRRFSEGIAKATKNRVSFIPFSWGPRICIGQAFALIEAKLALCMVLQHFSFELSPSYKHSPYPVVTLLPHAPLILKKDWRSILNLHRENIYLVILMCDTKEAVCTTTVGIEELVAAGLLLRKLGSVWGQPKPTLS
ncbi:hypothetical protein ACLOJK_010900 [Asimina triloba]